MGEYAGESLAKKIEHVLHSYGGKMVIEWMDEERA